MKVRLAHDGEAVCSRLGCNKDAVDRSDAVVMVCYHNVGYVENSEVPFCATCYQDYVRRGREPTLQELLAHEKET